ncbi:hypothetical protein CYQ88_10505 [Hydrogenovibrio sp. SC-1]|uniref:DUF3570 domain-containing protein n=1 Tax=Hydrogenovibrio sp. SC-1 TaxID=2065820 RepID=UPI000C7CD6EB|nr:DUF3570 domain-containing protein [Hydrogenovibrio sp. SC-1]PLA73569.1 hypothetical protein CYQ88_10505 [Hydrogenovibrio sp. SC-1]
MQLNRKLAMAVGSLLAVTQAQAEEWEVDSAVMLYNETDSMGQDRVSIFEPVVSITQKNTPDDYVKLDFVYDSLTGATPNGANASSQLQQFPKNNPGYYVKEGYAPLNTNFEDTRIALNLSTMKPIDRMSRFTAGASYSVETDYESVGGNFSYLKDFNNKQTTVTVGGAYTMDWVNPSVGFKDPFSTLGSSTANTTTSASGGGEKELSTFNFAGKEKNTLDMILGVSHVLNSKTLLNLNYGISSTSGYMTDDYKIISVIDGTTGFAQDYVAEARPDSRFKQTLKGTVVTAFGADSLHVDYRYFWDDWDVTAHTFDVKYYLTVGEKLTVRPHFRYSAQTQANFYRLSLTQGEALPKYASADYRLADMTTLTLGAMATYKLAHDLSLSFSMENITQSGDSSPAEAIGDQRTQDMFPTIDMWTYTFGLKSKF